MSGFATQDQARIATAVSEVVRNLVNLSLGGKVEFSIDLSPNAQQLIISVENRQTDQLFSGALPALQVAKRLMDRCEHTVNEAGTTVVLSKVIPSDAKPLTFEDTQTFSGRFDRLPNNVAIIEMQHQNEALLEAMQIGQARLDELLIAQRQLEATNLHIAELNAKLDERAEALQRADMYKDEFLAILSHELRGPISATGMAAQLLVAPPMQDARTKQLGQLISRQTAQMSRMVEDLLDVSRVSRGVVELKLEKVDMRSVLSDAVEQVDSMRQAKGQELRFVLPDEAAWVDGDHSRLVQMATNLLNNAIRYTQDGGEISIGLESDGSDWHTFVADNGIGIDAAHLPSLFDIYIQAERTSDRNKGGLGLGLALVRSLAELQGGAVSARSAGLGQGSTFVLRLPISAN